MSADIKAKDTLNPEIMEKVAKQENNHLQSV